MKNLEIILITILLSACAETQVVLLPDTNGKIGVVSIVNDGGTTTLQNKNESLLVSDYKDIHEPVKILTDEDIQSEFGDTLQHQPDSPVRFNLFFDSGSSELNESALAQIPTIVQTIEKRHSCDVSSIGNSDTTGTNKLNEGISLQRATNVKNLLINQGITESCIDIRYYGENDLFVKTPDETSEPQNRRVEIEVR